jgi:hypothetical protein
VLITGEDANWDRLSTRRHLHQLIGYLVEPSGDVVELEAIELVLQLADLLVVRSHLGVVAA